MIPSRMRRSFRSDWTEIPWRELVTWNQQLLQTDASFFQYPYWNEPFRKMYFAPRYLAYRSQGQFVAYVCILTFGISGLRIGLVRRGPVSLISDTEVPFLALRDLESWAKHEGYVFLRFTHTNPECLERLSSLGVTERIDAFPFYRDSCDELIVEQVEDDAQMLAGFQPIARRKIRKATEVGYDVRVSDSPEALVSVWPLFLALSGRKGFRYRPLSSYLDLMRFAQPHQSARLYAAYLGQQPVEAILIVRDRMTSHYMSGALDIDALQGKESPSCLLHWRAMRDFFHLGIKYYNLGTRSGTVYQFKSQFRPLEKVGAPPATLVISPGMYRCWSAIILRLAPSLWPKMKRIIFR
jgi:lipid II:glycine glycyltransferase (peptidoglycan interpeptide bridge formation enzyme)